MGTGIYIAAAITTLAAVLFYVFLILRLSGPGGRGAICTAALVALPLQPLAFYLVRVPLDAAVRSAIGTDEAYGWITTLYAPLTEEPAKWLPLAIPLVWRALKPERVVPLALAIGLGFGVGEIWFLAEQISRIPQYQALPFYLFGGFAIERFYVTFLHGGFVAFVVNRLATGRSFLSGALAGMALHYILNLPIFLASINAFGLPGQTWTTIASLFPLLMVIWLGLRMHGMRPAAPKQTGDGTEPKSSEQSPNW